MAKSSLSVERAVRLECLRVNAALEREVLAQSIVQASRHLQPGALLKSLLPSFASAQGSRVAWQVLNVLRRYPIVSSTLSAWLMGKGRRFRLLRLAGAGFLVWQIFKFWQSSSRH